MTINEWRRSLAWAIVHADGRARWQLDVYAKVGSLAMSRESDPELLAVYMDIAGSGPCNWNWHNGHRHAPTAAVLGRDPVRGERVTETLNHWVGIDADKWPDVLPVPCSEAT